MKRIVWQEITYKGVKLEVKGYYYKGTQQTHEQPADGKEFDIHAVYANGLDIIDLFDDLTDLERTIIEEHY